MAQTTGNLLSSNPLVSALQSKMSSSPLSLSPSASGGKTSLSTPAYSPPVASIPQAPKQPVTSHTYTGADGSTVKQTYASPEVKSATSTASPAPSTSTSTISPIPTQASQQVPGQSITDTSGNQGIALYDPMTGQPYASQTGKYNTTTGALNPGQTGYQAGGPADTSNPYAAAISNVGTVANQGANNIQNTSTGGANAIYGATSAGQNAITNASQPSSLYLQTLAQLQNLQQAQAANSNNLTNTYMSPSEFNAKQASLQNEYSQQESALASELQGAQTQENLGLTGATSAGQLGVSGTGSAGSLGLTGTTGAANQALSGAQTQVTAQAPVSQFGVLTSPTTGQPIGGGTAGQAAFNGGQITQQQTEGGQYQTDLNNIQAGRNQTTQLNSIITQLNLDPANVNAVNSGIQAIAKNTSSAAYQVLSNYLGGIAASYAPVLGQNAGTLTQNLINETAQGQSISKVISNLDVQAQGIAAGHKSTGTTGSISGSSSSDSGNSYTVGGITYNLPYTT